MTFWVSTFDDLIAAAVHGAEMSLEELGDRIAATSGPVKDALPTLKLARFGAQRSPDGSLRHDANVISATGVEADYDGEQMPFVDAVQRLQTAGVSFVAYTSPSNSVARHSSAVFMRASAYPPGANGQPPERRLGRGPGARKLGGQPGVLFSERRFESDLDRRSRRRGLCRRGGRARQNRLPVPRRQGKTRKARVQEARRDRAHRADQQGREL